MVHDGIKFSSTNHRGVLVSKIDGIDLSYMKYILEPLLHNAKKDREGDNGENEYTTLPAFMIKDIIILIPINSAGNIDLNAKKDMAQKYFAVQQSQQDVVTKLNDLITQKILI